MIRKGDHVPKYLYNPSGADWIGNFHLTAAVVTAVYVECTTVFWRFLHHCYEKVDGRNTIERKNRRQTDDGHVIRRSRTAIIRVLYKSGFYRSEQDSSDDRLSSQYFRCVPPYTTGSRTLYIIYIYNYYRTRRENKSRGTEKN